MVKFVFLFILLFPFVSSQSCDTTTLDPSAQTDLLQIYSNHFSINNNHVTYEIAKSPPSDSFDLVSNSIKVLASPNISSCPADCTLTLNRYIDTWQGNESTSLYFDVTHSLYLPMHYSNSNTSSIVCAKSLGFCGATVPIHRYYRISVDGVYHAYSFDSDASIDHYNQEYAPICYAWSTDSSNVSNFPSCGNLKFDISPSALTDLNIYDNNMQGTERDHYYTTLPEASVQNYTKTGVLGKVLTSTKTTNCSCLVKLQQVYDNQTGYFHRYDHKFIIAGDEPNRPYELYQFANETVYCAKRLGDCGASLPLWKHFQFYDVDSIHSTSSDPIDFTFLYPQTPLCYIWPTNYTGSTDFGSSGAPTAPTGPTASMSTSTTIMSGTSTSTRAPLNSITNAQHDPNSDLTPKAIIENIPPIDAEVMVEEESISPQESEDEEEELTDVTSTISPESENVDDPIDDPIDQTGDTTPLSDSEIEEQPIIPNDDDDNTIDGVISGIISSIAPVDNQLLSEESSTPMQDSKSDDDQDQTMQMFEETEDPILIEDDPDVLTDSSTTPPNNNMIQQMITGPLFNFADEETATSANPPIFGGPYPDGPMTSQPVKRYIEPDVVEETTQKNGIWKAGDWISTSWNDLFNGGKNESEGASHIGGLVGNALNSTENPFEEAKTWIDDNIRGNSTSSISDLFNSTGQFLHEAYENTKQSEFWNNSKTWVKDQWNKTGSLFSNKTGEMFGDTVDSAGKALDGMWNYTSGIGSDLKNASSQFLSSAGESINQFSGNASSRIEDAKQWAGEKIENAGEKIAGNAVNAWNQTKSFVSETGSSLVDNASSALNGAKTAAEGGLETVAEKGNELKENALNFWNDAKTWVGEKVGDAKETVGNVFHKNETAIDASTTVRNDVEVN